MLVELDVFSGKANPLWVLDEPVATRLLQMQTRLKVSTQPAAAPPSLGYRGFLYTVKSGAVRVFGGFAQHGRLVLVDPTFSLERFLLDHVPPEFAAIASRVAAEITGRR